MANKAVAHASCADVGETGLQVRGHDGDDQRLDDLAEMLNSATGDQREGKTFHEINLEFEKMFYSLLKNFVSIKSLMPFQRSSLRQTMIRKLSKVGKDKAACKKTDEYLTHLQDDDHMLTLDDTDAAIKRAEQHLHRNEHAGEDTNETINSF